MPVSTTRNVGVLNKVGSSLNTAATQLSYTHQKAKGQAINTNGKLTPNASLKAVVPRTTNQLRISFKTPPANGAAIAVARGKKIPQKKMQKTVKK